MRLRLAAIGGLILLVALTHHFWMTRLGQSLVCSGQPGRSDAILVENFDTDYLLFERAAVLSNGGSSSRVIALGISPAFDPPGVSQGFLDVMARAARLKTWETVSIVQVEPISLRAAYQIRGYLLAKGIKSIVVVTPGFRSRRSAIMYQAVLGDAGIAVQCAPVFGPSTVENWTQTWHGIQDVALQFLKLQYYRFYVLPMQHWNPEYFGIPGLA